MDFSKFAYIDDGNVELESSQSVDQTIVPYNGERLLPVLQKFPSTLASSSSLDCGLRELYKSPYQSKEEVLKVIIVGHNPSNQSWSRGHYYANPVNRMWFLLGKKSRIIPSHFTSLNDIDCPVTAKVGFTDLLFGVNETNSCKITDNEVRGFKSSLYTRLVAHVHRVAESCCIPIDDAYPRVIAFAGERQWKALFPPNHTINLSATSTGRKRKQSCVKDGKEDGSTNISESEPINKKSQQSILKYTDVVVLDDEVPNKRPTRKIALVEFGLQSARPPDWPKELSKSMIFLLPSSSGAAALTNEQREQPYIDLGVLVRSLEPLCYRSDKDDAVDPSLKVVKTIEVIEIDSE